MPRRRASTAAGRSTRPGRRRAAGWRPWYDFFPWEDWRRGRPEILETTIEPRLRELEPRLRELERDRSAGHTGGPKRDCGLGDDHQVAVFLDNASAVIADQLTAAGVPQQRLRQTPLPQPVT